jgi:betaine-aldehyde dehydrogenase
VTSGSAAKLIDSINPSTEELVAHFPDTSPDGVDKAVATARAAAREWASTPWSQRAEALRAMAAVIRSAEEELAQLDAVDSGNPIRAMRRDVRNAVSQIEYFAGLASEAKGIVLPSAPSHLTYTRREPYGVVARIIPFNHPIQFAAAKAAAPLAAGNAVIVKPAEQTSLSALRLGELVKDTFPPGVLQFVTGYGSTAGSALVRHPDIARIAFTGSVPTGQLIMRDAAEHVKAISLELGGKNPMIVFPDVDVAQAASAAVDGMNFKRSQGQSCGSNSRLFVHADIYSAFVEALTPLLTSIVIGDASDEATEMGPLAFRGQYDKVMGYIDRGIAEGARLVTGGKRPVDRDVGYFIEPTVFDNVDMSMKIAQEEIFGPVLSVFTWSDTKDVIDQANAVPFGLTANVWTNNLSVAHSVAAELEAGYVWVNGRGNRPAGAPFGGFGLSGLGKENSLDELLSYTRTKSFDVSL